VVRVIAVSAQMAGFLPVYSATKKNLATTYQRGNNKHGS